MKEQSQLLYQQMMAGIDQCSLLFTTEKEQIECCFQACEKAWNEQQKFLQHYHFSNDKAEIWFLKTVNPALTGMLEYYALVYKANLFVPEEDPGEIINFWQKELRYTRKFFREHETFYNYFKSGSTEMDELYFVRANNDPTFVPPQRTYNLDPQSSTTYDHLLAGILAREKYEHYVEGRISALEIDA